MAPHHINFNRQLSKELYKNQQIKYMKKNSVLYSEFLKVAKMRVARAETAEYRRTRIKTLPPEKRAEAEADLRDFRARAGSVSKLEGPAKDIRTCAHAFYDQFKNRKYGRKKIPIAYREGRDYYENYGWLESWTTFTDIFFQKNILTYKDEKEKMNLLIDWVKNYEYRPTPSVRNASIFGKVKNYINMKETTLKEAKEEFLQFFYNDIYWREKEKYRARKLKELRDAGGIYLYDWKIIDGYYKELIGRYGNGGYWGVIFKQDDYKDALRRGYPSIEKKLAEEDRQRREEQERKKRFAAAAAKSKVRPQLKF